MFEQCLVILGGILLLAGVVGCFAQRGVAPQSLAAFELERPSQMAVSPIGFGDRLFETVAVRTQDGSVTNVVLSRAEVALTFGSNFGLTNRWQNLVVDRAKLVKQLLDYRNERRGLGAVEAYLDSRTVQRTYSLAELGVRDRKALLEKFFERRAGKGQWWRLRTSLQFEVPRTADLIATLKRYDFEVSEMDLVPWLICRPKELPVQQ